MSYGTKIGSHRELIMSFFIAAIVLLNCSASAKASDSKECSIDPMVTQSVKLLPDCVYRETLQIRTSNVTLDCNGATLDGGLTLDAGIAIGARARISNVVVRNCVISNFKKVGIVIASQTNSREKEQISEISERYMKAPSGITIVNCKIHDIGNSGIYVADYVENISIIDSTIMKNRGTSIYLDFSSRNNIIRGNKIIENGFASDRKWRKWPRVREGIAVDSSAGNLIEGNIISGNAAGGIFLYKNCGEGWLVDHKTPIHWQSSDHNQIANNIISDMPIGVWVAQRQSVDLAFARCHDPYYFEGKIVLDEAKHNVISGNELKNLDLGVRVEDDDNAVISNRFHGVRDGCVVVGTKFRAERLNWPVRDAKVISNSCAGTEISENNAYVFSDSSDVRGYGCNTIGGGGDCVRLSKP